MFRVLGIYNFAFFHKRLRNAVQNVPLQCEFGLIARADKIFKNNKKDWSEFNEKDISNSLKQNTGYHQRKKQNKSDSSPKSLNWNAAFIIKETHSDRVNKCDQIWAEYFSGDFFKRWH